MEQDKRFFKIVNWDKAQPNMPKGRANAWMKLYTSLLDHDGYGGLDCISRNIIVCLWLYRTRSGLRVFPADPKWLLRKIPLLGAEPDLGPLAEAKDAFGNPSPFIEYCDRQGNAVKVKDAPGTQVATRTRGAQRDKRKRERKREKRKRKNRKNRTLSGSGKMRERKKKTGSKPEDRGQRTDEREQNTEDRPKAEKPENPKESGASAMKESGQGQVKLRYFVAKPARPAYNRRIGRQPQRLSRIIDELIPPHWRDAECAEFGWSMVEALGMPKLIEDPEIRSEAGAFTSFLFKLKNIAPRPIVNEIIEKSFEKARFICSPRCKTARNKSAEWTHIMYAELASRGISFGQKKQDLKL